MFLKGQNTLEGKRRLGVLFESNLKFENSGLRLQKLKENYDKTRIPDM